MRRFAKPSERPCWRKRSSAASCIKLNQKKLPGCYYHRSNPNDVARVEESTFICTESQEEAGPTNNWMAPEEMYQKLRGLATGAMRGRTMYVVPYLMGPPGSPLAKVGIELTDSIYVVLSMRIMTRMGQVAFEQLGNDDDFNRGLHCMLDVNPERRYIAHFPQDNAIISVGSNYGGNVLLGKKCLALRIGSYLARQEGWLAEHMLILGVESPTGRKNLRGGRLPQRLRQDQFRHDDAAAPVQGLEDLDRRRRHRLDEARPRRAALRHQSRSRLFRRRARHQLQIQPQRDEVDLARHHLHQRRADARPRCLVGRQGRPAAQGMPGLEGQPVDAGLARKRRRIPTAASPRR